ncbi:MAG: hypothetical protein Q4D27_03740, partial [Coriobacteriia bacterium]|nr:hypothetical protein [Coriobacteriia bacterium]
AAERERNEMNAQRFDDMDDALSAAEVDAEVQPRRVPSNAAAPRVAAPATADAPGAAAAPQDSMVIADVSTGRRRDAGSAFRREMAARVSQAEGAEPAGVAPAAEAGAAPAVEPPASTASVDGYFNDFEEPYGK